jgi:hypothetical protein
MNDSKGLPRVIYTGSVDLDPLHDWLDRRLPAFRAERLGRRWPNPVSKVDDGPSVDCTSPLDGSVRLGSYPAADAATVARAVQAARAGFVEWSERLTSFEAWRAPVKSTARLGPSRIAPAAVCRDLIMAPARFMYSLLIDHANRSQRNLAGRNAGRLPELRRLLSDRMQT